MTLSKTLQAVLDEDLEKLLRSIGQLERITNGDLLCRSCAKVITLENLQVIVPLPSGQFEFVCNLPACVECLLPPPELPNAK